MSVPNDPFNVSAIGPSPSRSLAFLFRPPQKHGFARWPVRILLQRNRKEREEREEEAVPPMMNTKQASESSPRSENSDTKPSGFRRVYTGTRWEQQNGYCRGLRAGNHIFITGTVAVNPDGTPYAAGDAERQAVRCFTIISDALAALDAGVEHLVRVRVYMTDLTQADAVGRAHRDWVGNHHPCLTLVGINELIDPAFLIEVEGEAIVHDAGVQQETRLP